MENINTCPCCGSSRVEVVKKTTQNKTKTIRTCERCGSRWVAVDKKQLATA